MQTSADNTWQNTNLFKITANAKADNLKFLQIVFFLFSWASIHCNFSSYDLGALSEDHTGNTMPTGVKIMSYKFSRIEELKIHTLSVAHTYIANPTLDIFFDEVC